MASSQSDFVDHLLEMLVPFDVDQTVTAKRMFGGHGIFRDGLMFGLVANGILYLKCDTENAAEFDDLDLQPFTYEKKTGTAGVMSYRECPDKALNRSDAMTKWANSAYAAALRNKKPKPGRKPKPKSVSTKRTPKK